MEADPFSELNPSNREWVERLYAEWLESPSSVPEHWARLFESLGDRSVETKEDVLPPPPNETSIFGGRASVGGMDQALYMRKSAAVLGLINAYRRNGHLVANLDPLGLRERPRPRELTLAYWDLSEDDLSTEFPTGHLAGPDIATLREIIERCERTYCGTLGSEFMYIRDERRRRWVERRVEETEGRIELDRETALRVLMKLTQADFFENFIHTKYLGAKRFSIEGGEALIPLLDLMIGSAGDLGVSQLVMGMAHRGRLNVLANILGKEESDIFEEFEDIAGRPRERVGDVKYHLGYSADVTTPTGRSVHLSLQFNPSHLEFVDPVIEGLTRAKQDVGGDADRSRILPLLIHGDGAFIGQGIVAETLNLARLPGYTTGGTIHVVVNNQISFTTPPESERSSEHPSDLVKVILPPVFHVNSADLGAVAFVARLAMEYRQKFGEDVVVDLVCYRKYGHNEADEPSFTNPLLYQRIRQMRSPLERFVESAKASGVLTQADVDAAAEAVRRELHEEFQQARAGQPDDAYRDERLGGVWADLKPAHHPEARDFDTRVEVDLLRQLLLDLTRVPEDFHLHPKLGRLLERRAKVARGDRPADWAAAEMLAYASLLIEGHHVRLTGQDTGRGTFSHRHAILYDQRTGAPYVQLNHLSLDQAPFEVYDSPLSEAGCLGFEWGYSLARPNSLVIWEAQFGDFANGAQVIIDQFLCSAEAKWHRYSGLVVYLPHGYEGQGPEHSSARLERFLQLSAGDNWQVVYPSTPAQLFHLLRGQLKRNYRRPLIVMTPKSLLRHPRCVSSLESVAGDGFRPVIGDPRAEPDKVTRLILCSGKVYYDLMERVTTKKAVDVAVVRVEQLYPLPLEAIAAEVARYPHLGDLVWCQEEPQNMGAFGHVERPLRRHLGREIRYAGRPSSPSPATGSPRIHKMEQDALVRDAVDHDGGRA